MTPLHLEILIWYIGRATDYRDGDFSAPAVREAIDWMRCGVGLLEKSDIGSKRYQLSERGRVFMNALLNTPLPVQVWVMGDKL